MPENLTDSRTSYKQIVKATSIFGGVSVVTSFISIIRTKIVAVLIGAAGIGINNLLNSTIGLIGQLTSLGLGTSAVRNVAAAGAKNDPDELAVVVRVLRRWVWVTGGLGLIVTVALSPQLSNFAFGHTQFTLAFILISVTLLFNQISAGQGVVLQGLRKIHALAKASIWGSILGLLISAPIYLFWGLDGIVPAIILISLSSLFLSWHFSRKVKLPRVPLSAKTVFKQGQGMITMGFMLTLNRISSQIRYYAIKIFISNMGGLAHVGLYTAGMGMINTYASIIFSSMSADYYPRLSAMAHDENESRKLINQQAEIAVLFLGPLLCLFITFSGFIITLLLSKEFLQISRMVQWAAMGIYFKAASWSAAFIFLAKGDNKLFYWNELAAMVIQLFCFFAGYMAGGLTGIGMGFMLSFSLYTLQVYLVTRWKYHFYYSREFIIVFIFQLSAGLICLMLSIFVDQPIAYVPASLCILFIWSYSFFELNKRLDIRNIVKKALKR